MILWFYKVFECFRVQNHYNDIHVYVYIYICILDAVVAA